MPPVNAELRLLVKEDASPKLRAARQEMQGLQATADKSKASVAGVFAQLGGSLVKVGATAAIADLGRQAIKAASDLQELTSKAQFVFKDAFPQVAIAATKAAGEVGRARSALLGMSADMGAVLESTGLSTQAVGEMSVALARLAVDMGSFHNRTDEEAFIALRSAITGETEPMKRLGVVMTQTNLEAYALSKGIKQKTLEMNQAQLATLRYNYILDKTKTVQGDAVRTGDSLANQMKRLRGEWQNTLETAGTPFLPVVAGAFQGVNELIGTVGGAVSALKHELIGLYTLKVAQEKGLGTRVQDGVVVQDYAKAGFKQANETAVFKNLQSATAAANAEARKGAGDWAKHFDELGGGARTDGKEGEDSLKKLKDALSDLGKGYQEAARNINQRLVDLDAAHREKMQSFRDQIDQTKRSIADLEKQYTRSVQEMDKRDADSLLRGRENIAALEEKLAELQQRRDTLYQQGSSIPLGLTDDIAEAAAELDKARLGLEKASASAGVGVFQNTSSLESVQSNVDRLGKQLGELNRKKEQLSQGQSVPVGLSLAIESTTKRLQEQRALLDLAKSGSASGVQKEFESRQGMTDIEKELADSQTRRDQLKAEFDERKGQYETELTKIREKQTAEETAYSSARTQLQLTQTALGAFHGDYIAKMADLSKVTQETVDGMNTKFEQLKETISGIDALLTAKATITGGGTLAERSAARGAQRLADIPAFGNGGTVWEPTLAIVGEKGPEKITPLNQAEQPTQVTNNFGPFYVSEKVDVNAVVNAITRKIQLSNLQSS